MGISILGLCCVFKYFTDDSKGWGHKIQPILKLIMCSFLLSWTLKLPLGLFRLYNTLCRTLIVTDYACCGHGGIWNLRVLAEKLCHWDLFHLQTELHIVLVLNKYCMRRWRGGCCLGKKSEITISLNKIYRLWFQYLFWEISCLAVF